MRDYAMGYKKWINDRFKSCRHRELRIQTKVYQELQKHVLEAHKTLEHAEHNLRLCQLQLQAQARLMRKL